MKALIVAAAVAACAASAWAHDWYAPECCSGRDCAPVPAHEVRLVATGYVVKTATSPAGEALVPFAAARPSADERFHKCERAGVLVCFFAPPVGA